MDDDLRRAVGHIYDWQYNNTGSFFNLLCKLIQKADPQNKAKINLAFPTLFMAMTMWHEAGDNGDDLFRRYGFM